MSETITVTTLVENSVHARGPRIIKLDGPSIHYAPNPTSPIPVTQP